MNWFANGKNKATGCVNTMKNFLSRLFHDRYKKRAIIYFVIAVAFIVVEAAIHHPVRPTVILLWLGVIAIAVLVFTQLKYPDS